MKMNIKTVSAFAAFAVAAFSAQAQTLDMGDIAVGFKSTGSTQNLIVDTGSYSTLAGYTSETTIGNFNTQLINAGFSAYTSGNTVNWGAAGWTGTTLVRTDFITKQWTSAGTLGVAGSSTPWAGTSQGSLNNGGSAIALMNTGFNGISATATGDGLSKTILASNGSSWTTASNNTGAAWTVFNPNANGFHTATNHALGGEVYSATDLYQLVAGSTTFLGTFALYTAADGNGHQAGDLTFTAVAIPEPSTYAAILGAVALAVVVYRRQRQAAALAA